MLVKTKTYVYLDCECGKALKHSVADSFSEDYTVIVEPCSCQQKNTPACEFYPTDDGCVCACNSDISGEFVCTIEFSHSCQWALRRRKQKLEDQLMSEFGLKTAGEIYRLGIEDGHMAAEIEERRK